MPSILRYRGVSAAVSLRAQGSAAGSGKPAVPVDHGGHETPGRDRVPHAVAVEEGPRLIKVGDVEEHGTHDEPGPRCPGVEAGSASIGGLRELLVAEVADADRNLELSRQHHVLDAPAHLPRV